VKRGGKGEMEKDDLGRSHTWEAEPPKTRKGRTLTRLKNEDLA